MLPVSICKGDGPLVRGLKGPWTFDASSSVQSAGVGGTVSSAVPVPGGRLARRGRVGTEQFEGLSRGRSRLWERADDGGGPGGGGGSGIPGAQVVGLGEWLAEREKPPARPRAPVDAALRAAGARIDELLFVASGD